MERPKVGDYYVEKDTGKEHQVLGIAHHTETKEIMVWHKDGMPRALPWVTPLKRWCELVDLHDGRRMFRYEWVRAGEVVDG
jgi:hypothetical protein